MHLSQNLTEYTRVTTAAPLTLTLALTLILALVWDINIFCKVWALALNQPINK